MMDKMVAYVGRCYDLSHEFERRYVYCVLQSKIGPPYTVDCGTNELTLHQATKLFQKA